MSLPKFHSQSKEFGFLQTTWATQLDPVIEFPPNQGLILKNIALINGTNTISHMLGKKLQGWVITGINAAATVYDAQASNTMPDKTLVLISNSAATCNLWVF